MIHQQNIPSCSQSVTTLELVFWLPSGPLLCLNHFFQKLFSNIFNRSFLPSAQSRHVHVEGHHSNTMKECYSITTNDIICTAFISTDISSITTLSHSFSGIITICSIFPIAQIFSFSFFHFSFLSPAFNPAGTSPLSFSFSFIFFSRYGMFSLQQTWIFQRCTLLLITIKNLFNKQHFTTKQCSSASSGYRKPLLDIYSLFRNLEILCIHFWSFISNANT